MADFARNEGANRVHLGHLYPDLYPATLLQPIQSHLPCAGIRGLLGMAESLVATGRVGALAVLAQVSAGVHRERGALALLDGDEVVAGWLRGGTLEDRLCQESALVVGEGRARCIDLEAADDSSHASVIAAENQGSLRILMLPLPVQVSPLREAIAAACAEGAWLRLRLELGLPPSADPVVGFGEARAGQRIFTFDPQGLPTDAANEFSYQVRLGYAPPPRLALLGAGPESRPLATLARQLGWIVELVDQRVEMRRFIDSFHVDRIHAIAPDALAQLLDTRHFDAAIVGSHDFELDASHLRQLGDTGIGYVALLGSPLRRDAMLTRMGDIIATQLEPRLYAPAGLHLGGEGPEIMALAIVAQLQRFLAHDVSG